MKHVEFGMDLEIKRDIQREATKGHNVTHVLYTGPQVSSQIQYKSQIVLYCIVLYLIYKIDKEYYEYTIPHKTPGQWT